MAKTITPKTTEAAQAGAKSYRRKQMPLLIAAAGLALSLLAAPLLTPGADAATNDGRFCVVAASDERSFTGKTGNCLPGAPVEPAPAACDITAANARVDQIAESIRMFDTGKYANQLGGELRAVSDRGNTLANGTLTVTDIYGGQAELTLDRDRAADLICDGADPAAAVSLYVPELRVHYRAAMFGSVIPVAGYTQVSISGNAADPIVSAHHIGGASSPQLEAKAAQIVAGYPGPVARQLRTLLTDLNAS